jgi:hypothetical protein
MAMVSPFAGATLRGQPARFQSAVSRTMDQAFTPAPIAAGA